MSSPATDEVVALAQELVRLDTVNPPGHERRAATVLAERLDAAGLVTAVQPLGPDRANVVARLRGGYAGTLAFSGHLDTVPARVDDWDDDPWAATVRDGRLYGRGACDMKGAVAAMTVAACRLARAGVEPPGDVVLAFTAGEETDSAGARLLVDSEIVSRPAAVVVGEPTRLDIGLAHKGALWASVTLSGRAAHGSQPEAGDNAAVKLLTWLGDLDQLRAPADLPPHPLLGSATMSLNSIVAGTAPNVVPDRAVATLDYRTLPGTDHAGLLDVLRTRDGGSEVEVLRNCVPVETDPADPFAALAVEVVRSVVPDAAVRGLPYVTDGSVFAEAWDVPVVFVGPGDERLAHVAGEWVAVDDLARAAAIYETLARHGLPA